LRNWRCYGNVSFGKGGEGKARKLELNLAVDQHPPKGPKTMAKKKKAKKKSKM